MPPQVRGPGPARQGERLSPRFQALQDAVAAGRAALASTATDADPEFVVVFDLAGSVEQFMRAVAKVPGLEFLVELEEDEADPDDDFHRVDQDGRIDDPVPESLYMVMTNARAVSELIRLFRLWEADQTVKFEPVSTRCGRPSLCCAMWGAGAQRTVSGRPGCFSSGRRRCR